MKKSTSGFTAVLAAFAAALFLKALVFDFMLVDGSSMLPALNAGEAVVVFRLAYGFRFPFAEGGRGRYLIRWKDPAPGDIAVFWTPLGELAVKRVSSVLPNRGWGGGLIMLGDNSVESLDSRSYGPVQPDNIIGKVLFRQ